MSQKINSQRQSVATSKPTSGTEAKRILTRKIEVKVPTKLTIGANTPLEFAKSPENALKGAFEIIITNGVLNTRVTFHSPIGITDLEKTDWVCTASADVPVLIQRKENPDAGSLQAERARARTQLLIQSKLLEEEDGKVFFPGELRATRDDINRLAREKCKAYEKDSKMKLGDHGYLAFLTAKVKECENRIIKASAEDSFKETVNQMVPDNYRTRSGVSYNTDQVRINEPGQVTPPDSFYAALVTQVVKTRARTLAEVVQAGKVASLGMRTRSETFNPIYKVEEKVKQPEGPQLGDFVVEQPDLAGLVVEAPPAGGVNTNSSNFLFELMGSLLHASVGEDEMVDYWENLLPKFEGVWGPDVSEPDAEVTDWIWSELEKVGAKLHATGTSEEELTEVNPHLDPGEAVETAPPGGEAVRGGKPREPPKPVASAKAQTTGVKSHPGKPGGD